MIDLHLLFVSMTTESRFTAIVRKKPSLPSKFLFDSGMVIGKCLDYGCGRGFDKDFYGIDGYDPYWFPNIPKTKFDTIICNFVLNVVEKKEQEDIIKKVRNLLNKNGRAFFTVRRDIKNSYRVKNYVQRLVILDYPSIYKKSRAFEIYRMDM